MEWAWSQATCMRSLTLCVLPPAPQQSWASWVGQDFPTQHNNLQFMELHEWPDEWGMLELDYIPTWLQCHLDVCTALKKPCLLGEVRDPLLKQSFCLL